MARIKVKLQTGEVGFIDDNEFNSSTMQKVDTTQVPQQQVKQNPQPVQKSTTANIGSKAIDLIKGILSPVSKLGGSLGESLTVNSKDTKARDESRKQLQDQISKLNAKSLELKKQGKTQESARLSDLATEQQNFLSGEYKKDIASATKGKEDIVKGAVGTGSFFVPGGNSALTRLLASTVAGAGFGYSGSEKGQELESTVGGGVIGGVTGGVLELLGKGASLLRNKRLVNAEKVADVTITGSKIKKDPFYSSGVNALKKEAQGLGITNKTPTTQKMQIIEQAWNTTQGQVDDLLRESTPVADDVIQKNLAKNITGIKRTKSINDLLTNWVEKLNSARGDNIAINAIKSEARAEMGNAFSKGGQLTARQEAAEAIFKTVKESLDTVSPQIRQINNQQNRLFGLSAEFGTQASKAVLPATANVPLTNVKVPLPFSQEGANTAINQTGNVVRSLLNAPVRGAEAVGQVAGQSPQVSRNVLLNMLQGNQPTQKATPETQTPIQAPTMPTTTQTPQQGQITAEMLNMAQLMLSPTEFKKIEDIYKRQSGETKKPLSGTNAVLFNKASTAIKTIDRIKTSIEANPKVLTNKALNPWFYQKGRQIGADMASAIDVLGYFRTGAAITADQRKDYVYMFPDWKDSPETVKVKLDNLKEEFEGYIKGLENVGSSGQDELINLLQSV